MRVTISKVNEVLFDGEAQAVNCPGVTGELTVLPHHIPIVTSLKAGEIRVRTADEAHTFTIDRGILEVSNNEVVILL